MSTVIQSKDPCPLCLMQNKVVNNLTTRPGQFYTTCTAGHKFEDTEELNILRGQARQRYPNLYRGPEPPPQADPSILANQDVVIDASTKQIIEELTKTTITGSQDLKGLIYAYVKDNEDKDAEIKTLRASMSTISRRATSSAKGGTSVGPGQLLYEIPEWAIEGGLSSQAEHAGMSVDDWLTLEITNYLENYFKSPAGRR